MVSPNLILKHHICLYGSLAQLVSPSVALPAELVRFYNLTQVIKLPSYITILAGKGIKKTFEASTGREK